MSRDDVHRLRREGLSIRSIANALGLSRMKVHRLLTTAADDGDPDPWDDGDDLALFDAEDDDPGCVEPFTYVGTERVWCSGAKGEGGRWSDERRYVDGTGRSWASWISTAGVSTGGTTTGTLRGPRASRPTCNARSRQPSGSGSCERRIGVYPRRNGASKSLEHREQLWRFRTVSLRPVGPTVPGLRLCLIFRTPPANSV